MCLVLHVLDYIVFNLQLSFTVATFLLALLWPKQEFGDNPLIGGFVAILWAAAMFYLWL